MITIKTPSFTEEIDDSQRNVSNETILPKQSDFYVEISNSMMENCNNRTQAISSELSEIDIKTAGFISNKTCDFEINRSDQASLSRLSNFDSEASNPTVEFCNRKGGSSEKVMIGTEDPSFIDKEMTDSEKNVLNHMTLLGESNFNTQVLGPLCRFMKDKTASLNQTSNENVFPILSDERNDNSVLGIDMLDSNLDLSNFSEFIPTVEILENQLDESDKQIYYDNYSYNKDIVNPAYKVCKNNEGKPKNSVIKSETPLFSIKETDGPQGDEPNEIIIHNHTNLYLETSDSTSEVCKKEREKHKKSNIDINPHNINQKISDSERKESDETLPKLLNSDLVNPSVEVCKSNEENSEQTVVNTGIPHFISEETDSEKNELNDITLLKQSNFDMEVSNYVCNVNERKSERHRKQMIDIKSPSFTNNETFDLNSDDCNGPKINAPNIMLYTGNSLSSVCSESVPEIQVYEKELDMSKIQIVKVVSLISKENANSILDVCKKKKGRPKKSQIINETNFCEETSDSEREESEKKPIPELSICDSAADSTIKGHKKKKENSELTVNKTGVTSFIDEETGIESDKSKKEIYNAINSFNKETADSVRKAYRNNEERPKNSTFEYEISLSSNKKAAVSKKNDSNEIIVPNHSNLRLETCESSEREESYETTLSFLTESNSKVFGPALKVVKTKENSTKQILIENTVPDFIDEDTADSDKNELNHITFLKQSNFDMKLSDSSSVCNTIKKKRGRPKKRRIDIKETCLETYDSTPEICKKKRGRPKKSNIETFIFSSDEIDKSTKNEETLVSEREESYETTMSFLTESDSKVSGPALKVDKTKENSTKQIPIKNAVPDFIDEDTADSDKNELNRITLLKQSNFDMKLSDSSSVCNTIKKKRGRPKKRRIDIEETCLETYDSTPEICKKKRGRPKKSNIETFIFSSDEIDKSTKTEETLVSERDIPDINLDTENSLSSVVSESLSKITVYEKELTAFQNQNETVKFINSEIGNSKQVSKNKRGRPKKSKIEALKFISEDTFDSKRRELEEKISSQLSNFNSRASDPTFELCKRTKESSELAVFEAKVPGFIDEETADSEENELNQMILSRQSNSDMEVSNSICNVIRKKRGRPKKRKIEMKVPSFADNVTCNLNPKVYIGPKIDILDDNSIECIVGLIPEKEISKKKRGRPKKLKVKTEAPAFISEETSYSEREELEEKISSRLSNLDSEASDPTLELCERKKENSELRTTDTRAPGFIDEETADFEEHESNQMTLSSQSNSDIEVSNSMCNVIKKERGRPKRRKIEIKVSSFANNVTCNLNPKVCIGPKIDIPDDNSVECLVGLIPEKEVSKKKRGRPKKSKVKIEKVNFISSKRKELEEKISPQLSNFDSQASDPTLELCKRNKENSELAIIETIVPGFIDEETASFKKNELNQMTLSRPSNSDMEVSNSMCNIIRKKRGRPRKRKIEIKVSSFANNVACNMKPKVCIGPKIPIPEELFNNNSAECLVEFISEKEVNERDVPKKKKGRPKKSKLKIEAPDFICEETSDFEKEELEEKISQRQSHFDSEVSNPTLELCKRKKESSELRTINTRVSGFIDEETADFEERELNQMNTLSRQLNSDMEVSNSMCNVIRKKRGRPKKRKIAIEVPCFANNVTCNLKPKVCIGPKIPIPEEMLIDNSLKCSLGKKSSETKVEDLCFFAKEMADSVHEVLKKRRGRPKKTNIRTKSPHFSYKETDDSQRNESNQIILPRLSNFKAVRADSTYEFYKWKNRNLKQIRPEGEALNFLDVGMTESESLDKNSVASSKASCNEDSCEIYFPKLGNYIHIIGKPNEISFLKQSNLEPIVYIGPKIFMSNIISGNDNSDMSVNTSDCIPKIGVCKRKQDRSKVSNDLDSERHFCDNKESLNFKGCQRKSLSKWTDYVVDEVPSEAESKHFSECETNLFSETSFKDLNAAFLNTDISDKCDSSYSASENLVSVPISSVSCKEEPQQNSSISEGALKSFPKKRGRPKKIKSDNHKIIQKSPKSVLLVNETNSDVSRILTIRPIFKKSTVSSSHEHPVSETEMKILISAKSEKISVLEPGYRNSGITESTPRSENVSLDRNVDLHELFEGSDSSPCKKGKCYYSSFHSTDVPDIFSGIRHNQNEIMPKQDCEDSGPNVNEVMTRKRTVLLKKLKESEFKSNSLFVVMQDGTTVEISEEDKNNAITIATCKIDTIYHIMGKMQQVEDSCVNRTVLLKRLKESKFKSNSLFVVMPDGTTVEMSEEDKNNAFIIANCKIDTIYDIMGKMQQIGDNYVFQNRRASESR